MLICKGQKMSNFIFSSIVALYLYYNSLVEKCKGQKLSVFYNLVNQRGGMQHSLPDAMFFTLIVQDSIPMTIHNSEWKGFFLFLSINNKSPTLYLHVLVTGIVHLACSNIIYHRWKYCKGQIMSVLI